MKILDLSDKQMIVTFDHRDSSSRLIVIRDVLVFENLKMKGSDSLQSLSLPWFQYEVSSVNSYNTEPTNYMLCEN